VRLGCDLLDERAGERRRAQNQHPLQERRLAHDNVQNRAERQQDTEDDGDCDEERLTGDSDLAEHGVEDGKQDKGDAEDVAEARRKFAEGPHDPEIIEVVVVERDSTAQRDRESLGQ